MLLSRSRDAPCRVRPRTLSPVQSLSDTSERHGPQASEASISKSPSAPLMSPCHPASPFAAHCTRPFEPGAPAALPTAPSKLAAQDSSPAALGNSALPVPPAEQHSHASRDRRSWRRASVPTALSNSGVNQVCPVASVKSSVRLQDVFAMTPIRTN